MERETGFEPATFGLGSRRSTAELLPHCLISVSYTHLADGNARLTAMSRTPVAVIPLDQSYEHPSIEAREEDVYKRQLPNG